jgi:hypothetical protein
MSRCDLITRVLTIKFGRKKKNIKTIQLSNRASQIFETDLYFFPFSRFIAARFIQINMLEQEGGSKTHLGFNFEKKEQNEILFEKPNYMLDKKALTLVERNSLSRTIMS